MNWLTDWVLDAWNGRLLDDDFSEATNTAKANQTPLSESEVRNVKKALLDSFPLKEDHPKHLGSRDLATRWETTKKLVEDAKNSEEPKNNVGRKETGKCFMDLEAIFKEELDEAMAAKRKAKMEQQKDRKKDPISQVAPLALGRVNDIGRQVSKINEHLSPRLGFTLGPMPVCAMKSLVMEYGGVEAMRRFQEHADAINAGEFDEKYRSFRKQVRESSDDALRVKKKNELNERQMEEGLNEYPGTPTKKELEEVSNWAGTDDLGFPCVYNGGLSKKQISNTKAWHEAVGLDSPWYLEKHQTRYLMDITGLTKDDKPNKKATNDMADSACLSSADSKFMSDAGAEAVMQVRAVVNAALNQVLGTEKEEREWTCQSGVIQTGASSINQDLHIDSKGIIDEATTGQMNVIKGKWKDGSSKEAKGMQDSYLNGGYVVDIPLSYEGSWLRIAVPNEKDKTFTMQWVYVPFGRALVRSVMLFHGGHYGSPGNTRFHCTMNLRGSLEGEKNLGYIQYLAQGKAKRMFQGWKLKWGGKTPNNPYLCDEFIRTNTKGTKYFKRFLMKDAKLGRSSLLIALTNLNTRCLIRTVRRDAKVDPEEDSDLEESKPKAKASGSKNNKKSKKRKRDAA